ncbi:MAG: M1 family metallopeptidase [Candidatus Zixiibacteriota bacterium]
MIDRLRLCASVLGLLFCCLMGDAADAQMPASATEFSPTEIHRIEAAGKIRAVERERALPRPAVVLDQAGFDATYYDLDLSIDEIAQTISSRVTMYARARVASFNAPTLNLTSSLTVDSVRTFGRPVTWSHVSGFLYVTLDSLYAVGEEFEVTVYYHGHPPTGGFQGFAFGTHSGWPIISTLSEPYLAQSWWPCKDTPSDKADSTDVRMRVNDALYGVSNGILRDSVNNGDGTITYWWHESYPITTYLVSLAITNYARFDHWYHHGPGGVDSMPVRFYSYPELLTDAQNFWPVSVTQIGVLADKFGEYPFLNEKYGIAHFTWGGAMEHQTVSSHTSGGFGFGQYLIVHELSHQWWGDMITCRDWHHIWLNEGFASYCEAVWAEYLGGTASYRNYMSSMNYFSGGRIYIDDTTNINNIFSTRVYDKGAWVLHMLRGIVGDSVFFQIMRTYYSDPDHQYKDAVTEEFRDIAEAVSGFDLHEFFADWIYGYYYPKYYVSWFSEAGLTGWQVYVHLRQGQTTEPAVFDMPVELRLYDALDADTLRVWNTARDQDYQFTTAFLPTNLKVDPNNWILDTAFTESYGVRILTDSLVTGSQYLPHHDSVFAKGSAAGEYGYTIQSGIWPTGLTLDTTTGAINGVPLDSGIFNVTIRAWGKVGGGAVYTNRAFTLWIAGAPYMPGDQNADRMLDIQDVVQLIDFVFRGASAPSPPDAADTNSDCVADLRDVVHLIDHVFRGGVLPGFGCLP